MDQNKPSAVFPSERIVIGIMVFILFLISGSLFAYLRSNPAENKLKETISSQQEEIDRLVSQKNSLTQEKLRLESQLARGENIYSTPQPSVFFPVRNNQYDSGGVLRITGIYETATSVIYTTNTPAYSTFLTWIRPGSKTQSYMVRGSRFDSTDRTTMTPGFGYQIEVYEDPDSPVLSGEYFFAGNRTVIADPRCPASVNSNGTPVCGLRSSCISDSAFVRDYCPLISR